MMRFAGLLALALAVGLMFGSHAHAQADQMVGWEATEVPMVPEANRPPYYEHVVGIVAVHGDRLPLFYHPPSPSSWTDPQEVDARSVDLGRIVVAAVLNEQGYQHRAIQFMALVDPEVGDWYLGSGGLEVDWPFELHLPAPPGDGYSVAGVLDNGCDYSSTTLDNDSGSWLRIQGDWDMGANGVGCANGQFG